MSAEDRAYVFIIGFTFYLMLQDLYPQLRVVGVALMLAMLVWTVLDMLR